MYELFLFYYTCWLLVVIIYFFMQKTIFRLFSLVWIFLIIITASSSFSVFFLQISVAYIVVVIGALFLSAATSLTFYEYFVGFTCMIGYAAIVIWELIAPIWFFLPLLLIVSPVIVIVLCLCIRETRNRIVLALLSLALGQLVFDIILIHYQIDHMIGTLQQMTILSTTLILLTVVEGCKQLFEMMIQQIKSMAS